MAQAREEICVTVTETVSEALETPVEELPPLSNAIDIDALDALVRSRRDEAAPGITVTFTYSGLQVLVQSGQIVYVRPVGDPEGRRPDWRRS